MLLISQLVIAIIILGVAIFVLSDPNKSFIFKMIAICLVITNMRFMLLYILQCTNRIKEYAHITIIDRGLYCFFIIIFLAVGFREYKLMIFADIIGRFVSLIYGMYYCSDIVFLKLQHFILVSRKQ